MNTRKQSKTVLDASLEERRKEMNAKINTNFLKEWQPYDKIIKNVERKILSHFFNKTYHFQPTHEEASKRPFKLLTFKQIDAIIGLSYTSTSDFAGLWVCNSGYLWADPTHYFICFAVNELGQVIGIANDKDENSIYIVL